jgi:cell filamentation protein
MTNKNRYKASGAEGEFEPGSNELVLRNLLQITDPTKMEEIESNTLAVLMEKTFDNVNADQQFTAELIFRLHHDWLKDIYSWAGTYRQVNVSKSGFSFAAAHRIHALMDDFEKKILAEYTPCLFSNEDELIEALAIVHTELVLIHPFREGNGRIARLISILMAMQAKHPLLNFSSITGENREAYFTAVQAGLDCNYEPMKEIFKQVLSQSL